MKRELDTPSTHDIGLAAENFRQATDDHIHPRQNLYVGEVAYCFIAHNEEVIRIRKLP